MKKEFWWQTKKCKSLPTTHRFLHTISHTIQYEHSPCGKLEVGCPTERHRHQHEDDCRWIIFLILIICFSAIQSCRWTSQTPYQRQTCWLGAACCAGNRRSDGMSTRETPSMQVDDDWRPRKNYLIIFTMLKGKSTPVCDFCDKIFPGSTYKNRDFRQHITRQIDLEAPCKDKSCAKTSTGSSDMHNHFSEQHDASAKNFSLLLLLWPMAGAHWQTKSTQHAGYHTSILQLRHVLNACPSETRNRSA